jgi:hypothetical protein
MKMNKKLLIGGGIALASMLVIVSAVVLYHMMSVDITVNEALSTTTMSISLSGFAGETVTKTITINNQANVPLDTTLSWAEDTNANGVVYTPDMPKVVTLSSGDNDVDVSFMIDPSSPVGAFNGTISLTR